MLNGLAKVLGRKLPYPANIYLFKVNNRSTRKGSEICSKLVIKTPCSSVSIVNVSWTMLLPERRLHLLVQSQQ